jgi:hypothetical protein
MAISERTPCGPSNNTVTNTESKEMNTSAEVEHEKSVNPDG